MIHIAGGKNIFGDVRTQWSQISVEAIVKRQPDVIIVAQRDMRSWQITIKQPGWRDLRAVQAGRVYFVDGDRFHHPGPGLVENVRQLAGFLHNGVVQ
jgi:iron complex transport system substrate-binding protein